MDCTVQGLVTGRGYEDIEQLSKHYVFWERVQPTIKNYNKSNSGNPLDSLGMLKDFYILQLKSVIFLVYKSKELPPNKNIYGKKIEEGSNILLCPSD